MLFLVILGFDKIKYPEWIKNGIIRVVELSWVLLGIVYKEIALKGVYKIYNSADKFSIFGPWFGSILTSTYIYRHLNLQFWCSYYYNINI